MHRSIYLLWLPIALLTVSVRSNEQLLQARDALAAEISSIEAEFGDSVDTSLDGYDHELVTRDEHAAESAETWGEKIRHLPAKAARVLKPHHKVTRSDDDDDDKDDEDEVWAPVNKREMIEHEKRALEAMYQGEEIDFSLEGYDERLLDEDDDEDQDDEGSLHTRGEAIDYSLEGYDEKLLEEAYAEDGDDDDLSLEKRSSATADVDEDGEEYELPPGDGSPYEADFDSSQYLSAWDSHIQERDFADEDGSDDGDEGLLGTAPDAEYGPEDDEMDVNDRYHDEELDEGVRRILKGAIRRSAPSLEDDEVDGVDDADDDWFVVVKRWVGLE